MATQAPDLTQRYFALHEAAHVLEVSESHLLQLASTGEIEVCVLLPKVAADKWFLLGGLAGPERFRADLSPFQNLVAVAEVAAQTTSRRRARNLEVAPLAALALGQPVHAQTYKTPSDPSVWSLNDPRLNDGALIGHRGKGPLLESSDLQITAMQLEALSTKFRTPSTPLFSHPSLNPEHPYYAAELAAALRGWEELFGDGTFDVTAKTKKRRGESNSPKSKLTRWLVDHRQEFSYRGEPITGAACKVIARVANPSKFKPGGATPTFEDN